MKRILLALVTALLIIVQIETSHATKVELKEWTFLVFMNGHDNVLSPFTDSNLKQMQKVGSTDEVNIVVQVASMTREKTERVYIEKGNHRIIEKLPRVDMGDYKELNKFIEWAVKNYPAKKYFINVWNHGTGWHDIQLQDVSYDSISGNYITTEQMGKVMKRFSDLIGHKVELYGNDACLMSMIEIAAEFTDSVSYFVSSQENEPAAGWPYDKLLARWVQNPEIDGAGVGKILTEEYLKYYPDDYANPMGTTFSTIDVSRLDALMDSLSNLRNELMGLGAEKIKSLSMLSSSTHNFEGSPDYKDILDFVLRLEKHATLGVNKSITSNVKNNFKDAIVKSVNSESEEGAHGLSVWLPTYSLYYEKHIERYRKLEFNKKTGWADLLDLIYNNKYPNK